MKNTFSLEEGTLAEELLRTRSENEKRTCKGCGKEDLLKEFPGRVIKHLDFLQVSFRSICKVCDRRENAKSVARARKGDRDYRRACSYWSRSSRLGVKSDLKLRDIRIMLRCPCYYCESKDVPMTLDRKDSSGGYLKSNTVPCCARCNVMKSDMPYEAWQRLVPAIKNVAKLGLFGGWKTS